jgi:hypothetical protein
MNMKRRSFLTSLLPGLVASAAALIGMRRAFALLPSPATGSPDTRRPDSPDNTVNYAHCVLCGKTREQAKKLIVGARGSVCLECVALCNDIIQADARQS